MHPKTHASGLTPEPQGVNGYDACWYPIALSAEVAPGLVHGAEFLDGRVVAVRSEDGRASVLSAYCRHLGADLVDGDVVDGCVRCPFHHWRYDLDGHCVGTAVGDRVPSGTSLFAFPTAERWGIIWAFNGSEPTYEIPSWDEPESERFVISEMALDHVGDPFIAPLNVFDVQHLRSLHGLDADVELVPGEGGLHFDMRIGGGPFDAPVMSRHAQLIGTNAVVYSGTSIGIDSMAAAVPYRGRSRLYLVTGGLRSVLPAETITTQVADRHKLSLDALQQDLPVLERIRFRADTLTKSDRAVVTFLQFANKYPRAHPSAEFIT